MSKLRLSNSNKSIVLVGHMGSGKSTIGKNLSKKLGIDFFDSDKEIELREKIKISNIFSLHGEKYFRNCLLDFNEANNVAQWQWVAGCGADAAPYFRIFNPILQGEKFDKQGEYVKKWVPELKNVPPKFIHKPWELELKYQEGIKTIIGKDYPKPIVIHEQARAAALQAFQSIKKN